MFDLDMSFDFNTSSQSPVKQEASGASSSFHSSPSSNTLSPPTSTLDSVSQDGHGNSPQWKAQVANNAWAHKSFGADYPLADDPWIWTSLMSNGADVPVIARDEPLPLSIDPAALSYYNGLTASLLGIQEPLFPTISTTGFVPPTQLFPPMPSILPQQALPITTLPQLGIQNQPPLANPLATGTSSDRDIALRAMAAAGIQSAVTLTEANTALIAAQNLPNMAAPKLTKPDLAACPPLAKHVLAVLPSARSPGEELSGPPMGISGRPKTSHTTIERRYRTNLNARITALRQAVPALRVLDKDHASHPEFAGDVVDDRGYVDGVKAARKASKASILGKAAEYIHVLKKREIRLRHELAGFRTLLSCLVGGEALLREFDASWTTKYGTAEMDEVANSSDCDDADEESDEDPTPRKRAKVSKESAPAASVSAAARESAKRKRGRPKKGDSPPESPPAMQPVTQVIPQDHLNGSAQYLLGAFLFFSLVKPNSDPLPAYDLPLHTHQHAGSVYSPPANATNEYFLANMYRTWSPTFHNTHTVLSALLLLSVSFSVLSGWLQRRRPQYRASLKELMDEGAEGDVLELEDRLRVAIGSRGIINETILASGSMYASEPPRDSVLEAACWRLANLTLLRGDASPSVQISTALTVRRLVPSTAKSLSTIAFLCLPVSRVLAEYYWRKAARVAVAQRTKGATLTVLRTSLDEALSLFARAAAHGLIQPHTEEPPILHAGQMVVVEAVSDLAHGAFIQKAYSLAGGSSTLRATGMCSVDLENAIGRLEDIGRGVGGVASDLLRTWLEVVRGSFTGTWSEEPTLSPFVHDVRDVIDAVGCMRRIEVEAATGGKAGAVTGIPSTLLLRRALAAPIFSRDEELEDARDNVIDRLFE